MVFSYRHGIWISATSGTSFYKSDAPAVGWSRGGISDDGSRMICGSYDSRAYISINYGENWVITSAGESNQDRAVAVKHDGSTFYLAHYSSGPIWKLDLPLSNPVASFTTQPLSVASWGWLGCIHSELHTAFRFDYFILYSNGNISSRPYHKHTRCH